MPGKSKKSEQWSPGARFAAIVETATFSEVEIAEYCRKKGLYPEQLIQRKQGFIQTENPADKAALKQSQKEIKQLKKELLRKEKALAAVATFCL